MSTPPPAPAADPDLLAHATTALDVLRLTGVHGDGPPARSDLDAFHAHTAALYGLLDSSVAACRPTDPATAGHLHAARIRLWQAADQFHLAYHARPAAPAAPPPTPAHPEGRTVLTICQRHQWCTAQVRRIATPADLRSPSPGLPTP
ncbi:hypothetical protein ABH940_005589 [Streptacidiphilus sp. BW17]|uniref:DUF6238 family protein n=1 Tax=Streptacidiphilus sp. BW17 TaxID=3156274 RepID=UPI003516295B